MRPLCVVLVVLAGCGSTVPGSPEDIQQKVKRQAADPTVQQNNRDTAEAICSTHTVAQVAKEYGTRRTAEAAARGMAATYREGFRDAVYEGCLAGFR